MTSKEFSMPRDGELFIASIRERCESCVDAGIWAGIDKAQLRIWMNQFDEGCERYFAACVLDSLIYRSTKQTIALMEHLFQRTLPSLAREDHLTLGRADGRLESLARAGKGGDPGIRVVPVIRNEDPPTKSGPLITRMYKQYLGIDERWIIWPQDMAKAREDGTLTFLFVDDFLGTGDQFMTFASRFNVKDIMSGLTAIYAPLAAHETGLSTLKDRADWLHVCCVERLSPRYSLFSELSSAFSDGENSSETARSFYLKLLDGKHLDISGMYVYGYGRLALTYVFEHAVPDNNIPLLWYASDGDGWEPLFRR